jgi:hypothetical protein
VVASSEAISLSAERRNRIELKVGQGIYIEPIAAPARLRPHGQRDLIAIK